VLLAAIALGSTLAGAPADEHSIDRFLAQLRAASDRNDDGDYLIEIVREAKAGESVLTYTLAVTIR
jgi:hypothetical protein